MGIKSYLFSAFVCINYELFWIKKNFTIVTKYNVMKEIMISCCHFNPDQQYFCLHVYCTSLPKSLSFLVYSYSIFRSLSLSISLSFHIWLFSPSFLSFTS